MDGNRFDDLTRALAAATSRRQFLKTLAGGTVGGLLAMLGVGEAEARKCRINGSNCRSNADCCSGFCPNTTYKCACPAGTMLCGNGKCQSCCTAADCNDNNACTTDTCNNGQCQHAPIAGCCNTAADCNDNNACTTDTCVNHQCQHQPINCDDGDPCTVDTCDPQSGCVHTPVTCSGGQVCQGGQCVCPSGQELCQGQCYDPCPAGTIRNPDTCQCEAPPNPSCAGATCQTFIPCSTNTDCVCTTVAEGGGLCVPGSTPCAGLTRCPNGTVDCPVGELCVVNTCCVEPVCVAISLTCPPDAPTTTAAPASNTGGPTIAHR